VLLASPRAVVLSLLGVLIASWSVGCGSKPKRDPAQRASATAAGARTAPTERVAGSSDRTGEGVTSAAPASPATMPSSPPATVTFPTSDGVTISATLRVGETGTIPIVLVHQLGSTRAEWEPLVAKLAAEGWTTLALDLRGHGESTAGTGSRPRTLAYGSFRDTDWRDTQRDVRAALDFLAGRQEIAAQSAVLVGSSIGGTACLAAAAEDPRASRVAVLSPGRAYRGFDAIIPASKLGERELLILRAQDEAMTQETGEVLDRIVTNSTLRLVPGGSHGVAMLADDPTQLDALVEFVRAAQPR
jgi:pimeloyl-ACP methyl ester carboxylesterase